MKVFIAGAREIVRLDKMVTDRLYNIYQNNISVLVGDANGVDKSVQQYFQDVSYKNVEVYAMDGRARNNIGNWKVNGISASSKAKGFDYYAAKDLKMAENADYGFMIWNGKSKGTLNNIINLTRLGKETLVYLSFKKHYYKVTNINDVRMLMKICNSETEHLFFQLANKYNQLSVFS